MIAVAKGSAELTRRSLEPRESMPQTTEAHVAWAVLAVRLFLDFGAGCEWKAEGGHVSP